MRRLACYSPFLILLVLAPAWAAEPPMPNPNDAVFDATDAVIASHKKADQYQVERSYLGDLKVGAVFQLRGFQLVTWDKMGDAQPQPTTCDTRILLFLRPDEKNRAALTVAEFGDGFFFRDAGKIDELDTMARQAVDGLKKWQSARDQPDRHARIHALFPYLLKGGYFCFALTEKQLATLSPDAGDYLASKLGAASHDERMSLLRDVSVLQSPNSHAAAMSIADRARRQIGDYLTGHHLKKIDFVRHWQQIPATIQDADGEIYYGAFAVETFGDPADLPWFRDMVPFLLANDLDQSVEVCVFAMRRRPSSQNLPMLKAVWEDYKKHPPAPGTGTFIPIDVANALDKQNDPAAIPILAEILDDHEGQDSAYDALMDVTHMYFNSVAECRAWCAAHVAPTSRP